MARKAGDITGDAALDVVNPNDDTSVEALDAWVADVRRDDEWIDLPTTAARSILEDRTERGS